MTRPFFRVLADSANVPLVEVPRAWVWDVIEYLSYQGVAVHYDFNNTHFTATFPKQGTARVQELLDGWSHGFELEAGATLGAR